MKTGVQWGVPSEDKRTVAAYVQTRTFEAQHNRNSFSAFHPYNKETKHELEINLYGEPLSICWESRIL